EIGVLFPSEMEDLLQHLTEVSIRQQQTVEHLATRQGRAEEELAAIRDHPVQHVPLPDPRVQATRLLPKMTAYESLKPRPTARAGPWKTGHRRWHPSSPEKRSTFISHFHPQPRRITPKLGLSPICATEQFQEWEYKAWVPAPQVVERVVIDRLLRALPRSHRQAVGMRNPTTTLELVEAIKLADAVHHWEAGERVPPFPRGVVQERCALESTPRTVGRLTVPSPQDEPMPTAEPTTPPRTWVAGCIVHQCLPPAAPEADVTVNGKPMRALLDSE
ncbi:hypothetical protein M9458_047169, partial [Cirrhinus mrigala]